MPRRDRYHDAVAKALKHEGWAVTDDPLRLSYGGQNLYVDLGAELLGFTKDDLRIAVEVKSFLGASPINDLEHALGQYNLYRDVLNETDPDRILYLAIPERAYRKTLTGQFGQLVVERQDLRLIVFHETKERIVRWIPKL